MKRPIRERWATSGVGRQAKPSFAVVMELTQS